MCRRLSLPLTPAFSFLFLFPLTSVPGGLWELQSKFRHHFSADCPLVSSAVTHMTFTLHHVFPTCFINNYLASIALPYTECRTNNNDSQSKFIVQYGFQVSFKMYLWPSGQLQTILSSNSRYKLHSSPPSRTISSWLRS